MKQDITKEEALSLLQWAASEPLGLLVYASDPQVFIQALYRARAKDPYLSLLQIRQTPEGIAICHEPTHPPGEYNGADTTSIESTTESEEQNDQTQC